MSDVRFGAPVEASAEDTDMVRWEDGTHEIFVYNDENGCGLTRCEKRIGPWDIWLSGQVTCQDCVRVRNHVEAMEKRKLAAQKLVEPGPHEWFPALPTPKIEGPLEAS